jgi:HEAT repeat protein
LSPRVVAEEQSPRDPELLYAERTLADAKAAVDGPGVLAFLRRHTLSEDELDKLAQTVRRLGAPEFAERERAAHTLIAAGRAALPHLRAAVNDPDLEIARRARRCVEEIERSPTPHVMIAAALVLKDRRPPGTTAALLAYLPCIADETLEDAWLEALRAVAVTDGRADPALVAALKDHRAIRRAAAAHVLGRATAADLHQQAVPLLADADPRVRFEAAAGLARFGDKKAVRVLIDLLRDAPVSLACRSEDLLCQLVDGQAVPTSPSRDDPAARRACHDAWEQWWQKNADRVDLTRLRREEPQRGLTIVCEYDGADKGGRVWQWGPGGKSRWELTPLEGPNDVQLLPRGRLLIAERNANRVTERDYEGKILWQHHAPGNPVSCQRLPNGNTLVATFRELYEVTSDQKKVLSYTNRAGFRHAVKLPNDHVVLINGNGLVIELDATWKHEIRTIRPADYSTGATFWASIEPLPGGRYLLALGGTSRVIEIDTTGKIHWECTVPSAVFATRLRNGHTLVSSFEGRYVIEVDRSGKEVSKQSLRGRPFAVRRY